MPRIKVAPKLPYKKIGIAGLGLIGGSLAKALMPFGGMELYVFDTDEETIKISKTVKRIKESTNDVEEFLSWPLELAYLCLPVKSNIELIELMGRHKIHYSVTDAGSTKLSITEAALKAGVMFCGGHPIAGKELSGFKNSTGDLIRNCLYILTPDKRFGSEQEKLLQNLKALHSILGCRIEVMSPKEHDQLYALVSHLPYLSASALAGTIFNVGGDQVLPWTGTGFKDSTRVAASTPMKWVEIVMDNADNLADDLDVLMNVLADLKSCLISGDSKRLLQLLDVSSEFRQKLKVK